MDVEKKVMDEDGYEKMEERGRRRGHWGIGRAGSEEGEGGRGWPVRTQARQRKGKDWRRPSTCTPKSGGEVRGLLEDMQHEPGRELN